jgi:hypothetical protein
MASSAASRARTADRRVSPTLRATSAPSTTPMTNRPINARAVRTIVHWPVAIPTPSRVELPLMNETKKPPSFRNPMAST